MSAARDRHRVAVLVMPGVLALDFGIPAQVFAEDPHYDLVVCAETAAAVASSGFAITAPPGSKRWTARTPSSFPATATLTPRCPYLS
jgi:hypothetical protein